MTHGKHLTVRIGDAYYDALRRAADAAHVSVSTVARQAIGQWLADYLTKKKKVIAPVFVVHDGGKK